MKLKWGYVFGAGWVVASAKRFSSSGIADKTGESYLGD